MIKRPTARRLAKFLLAPFRKRSAAAFSREVIQKPNVDIGEYTYGKPEVLDWGEGARLVIGRFCSLADGVTIILGGNHRPDWVTTYPFSFLLDDWPVDMDLPDIPVTKGDVIIGSDVWVGHGAMILSGVEIGHGAVIGAGAVVAKNVEPYAVMVGNPAKMVRKRFDEDTIARLLSLAWWDWPIEKIRQNAHVFYSGDVRLLLESDGSMAGRGREH